MADGTELESDTTVSEEEKQSLIGHDLDQRASQKPKLWTRTLAVGATLLLACSIAFYIFIYLNAPSDYACERLNWAWSPMMEDLAYEWRQYDSDLVPDEYFGPLTKERRAIWYAFREQGYIAFPEAQLPLLDKSLDDRDWWKLSPPRHDQLMAFPEVVHQAHCVGFMYLFLHRNEWDFSDIPAFKRHGNHCIEAIMRIVMCNADVTPVLLQEDATRWKTRDAPHRCKNWDALNAWQADHKVCGTNCQPWDMPANK